MSVWERFADWVCDDFGALYLFGALLLVLLGLYVWGEYQADQFVSAHHCRATNEIRDRVFWQTFQSNGTTIIVPQYYTERRMTCDDGSEIWR